HRGNVVKILLRLDRAADVLQRGDHVVERPLGDLLPDAVGGEQGCDHSSANHRSSRDHRCTSRIVCGTWPWWKIRKDTNSTPSRACSRRLPACACSRSAPATGG